MGSSLSPNPSDTTNALLKILINKVDNGTFSEHDASLPIWLGPPSTVIWIQTLAYASLSASLLSAFGAVLCKQWLGYFNTSRFGKGSLGERCKHRQRKLDELETWQVRTIIDTLPILLQLSLLFFGIALSANIWAQAHTVASVIIGTTALGVVFYSFTVIASLKSPDCPFQTPVSTMLKSVCQGVALMIRRPSWSAILSGSRKHLLGVFRGGYDMVMKVTHILRHHFGLRGRDDLESAIVSGPTLPSAALQLKQSVSSLKSLEARSIRWILETSTDMDTIIAAVRMVPEIDWLAEDNLTDLMDQLESHLYGCLDVTQELLSLTRPRALLCLKAIMHLHLQRDLSISFRIRINGIDSMAHSCFYNLPTDSELIILYCVQGLPVYEDLMSFSQSLSLSGRMWMAHMFTYRLRKGDCATEFEGCVIRFISACLDDETSPGRLVADCLLSVGLLIGWQHNQQHLPKLEERQGLLYYSVNAWLTVFQGRYSTSPRFNHYTLGGCPIQ